MNTNLKFIKNPENFILEFNEWLNNQNFKDFVKVQIRKRKKDIYISNISVKEKNFSGIGTKIMKKLIDLSNKYKIPLKLEVDLESEDGYWLESWYQKLGFEYTLELGTAFGEFGPYMTYRPS